MLVRVAIGTRLLGLPRRLRVGIVALGALLMAPRRAVLLHLVAGGALFGDLPAVGFMAGQASRMLVRRRTLRLMTTRTVTLHG